MGAVAGNFGEAVAMARPRVIAALAAQFRDLDLADDALAAAVEAALMQPEPPRDLPAWLYVTARRKALDIVRRRRTEARAIEAAQAGMAMAEIIELPDPMPDERLRLLFVCCHPALAMEARIVLALRVIMGVAVPDIAAATLASEAATYQRITRAKAKIKRAGIPFETPPPARWRERVAAVLATLEAAFALAYRDGAGTGANAALGPEVDRLASMLAELLAGEAEVLGLAATIALARSRERARVDGDGCMIPLSQQDAALWDMAAVERARQLVDAATALRDPGPHQMLAAIQLTHANRAFTGHTDWPAIARLYDALYAVRPDAVVGINRAVAVGRASIPAQGLAALDSIEAEDFLPLHVARGDLLERAGERDGASAAFAKALQCGPGDAERLYLERRLAALT